jgi:hypothetical protein
MPVDSNIYFSEIKTIYIYVTVRNSLNTDTCIGVHIKYHSCSVTFLLMYNNRAHYMC